jgi:hypothetical protein
MSVKSFKTSGVGVDLAPQGLVLINTTSFSGVASQSVSSVFSATYDNYRIVFSLTSSSDNDIFVRLRSNSTDETGSNYTSGVLGVNNTTVSAARATQAYWYTNQIATGTEFSAIYDLFNPFKAQVTHAISSQYVSSTTNIYGSTANLRHNLTNSYNGITIYSNSAPTITGAISVYGYNK